MHLPVACIANNRSLSESGCDSVRADQDLLQMAATGTAAQFLDRLRDPTIEYVYTKYPCELPDVDISLLRNKIKDHFMCESAAALAVHSDEMRTALDHSAPIKALLFELCDKHLEILKLHLPAELAQWESPQWFGEAVIAGAVDAMEELLHREETALMKVPGLADQYRDRAKAILLDNLHIYDAAFDQVVHKQPVLAEQLRADAAVRSEAVAARYPVRPYQPDLSGRRGSLVNLKLQAARAFPGFAQFITAVGDAVGVKCMECLAASLLKTSWRIVQKGWLRGDLESICDVVRGLIVVPDCQAMLAVHQYLFHRHDEGRIEIVGFKDRISHPTDGGWRDLVYLVRNSIDAVDVTTNTHQTDTRHICEVQVVLRSMLTARRGMDGHAAYAEARHLIEMLGTTGEVIRFSSADRLTEVSRLQQENDHLHLAIDARALQTTAELEVLKAELVAKNTEIRRLTQLLIDVGVNPEPRSKAEFTCWTLV
jgi:hypothetical protein